MIVMTIDDKKLEFWVEGSHLLEIEGVVDVEVVVSGGDSSSSLSSFTSSNIWLV